MTLTIIASFLLQTVLAAKRPALAVAVVLALLPSYLVRTSIAGIPVTILEALVLGAIAGWIFFRVRQGQIHKKFLILIKHPLFVPGILFLFAGTVAIAVSPDLQAALGLWKSYIMEPLLFGLVVADVMRDPKDRLLALLGLSVSALFVVVITILQRFAGFPIPNPWQVELRVTGPFEFPNAVGLLLAPIATLLICASVTFTRHSEAEGRRISRSFTAFRMTLLSVGFLSVAAIVFSKTEAGLVGIFAGLLLFGFIWSRRTRLVSLGALVIAAALIAMPGVFPPLQEKILLRDWSGVVRRNMWGETVTMLRDRPLSGAGLSGYPETVAPYHKDPKIEIFQYPHNIVLNFWSEMGLLGLIAFGWIVFEFFRLVNPSASPLTLRGERLALAAAMATLLIHGLVDVPYFKNDLSILFWTLVGLASSLRPAPTLDPSPREGRG